MSASPESLSRTRLNAGLPASLLVMTVPGSATASSMPLACRRGGLRRHLGGEVAAALLQALAHDIKLEACDRSTPGLEQGLHRLFVVFDEGLAQQRDFLE